MRTQHGFTLIELMIVVVIIGILAAIALPNFARMAENSRRASCISNQRNIHEMTILYAIEERVSDQVINVGVLQANDYIGPDVGECPSSPVEDFDDYRVTIVAGHVTAIQCDVKPARHLWTPPVQ